MKYIFLFLSLCFSSVAVAQEYKIIFDKDLSPYSGSSMMISTYNFYKALDDKFLPSSYGKVNLKWRLGRVVKTGLNYVPASYLMVFQHEVFGHGYRGREFDFSYLGYNVRIDSGYTSFSASEYAALGTYQKTALTAAGLEANTILSQQIRQSWLQGQKLDNRDAMSYVLNQIEQVRYVYLTYSSNLYRGNDVTSYISLVNQYNGDSRLNMHKMRRYILWDLLDSGLFTSLYGIGKYIYDGTPAVSFKMIDIQGYEYLPAARTIFAPWGLEFQVQNFIRTPNHKLLQVNLRYGGHAALNSFGIDFMFAPIWQYKKFYFSNQVSIWRQPNLIYANAAVAKAQFGFADFISIEYKAFKNFGLVMDLGYKTAGFIQGFQLANDVILRFGCKW